MLGVILFFMTLEFIVLCRNNFRLDDRETLNGWSLTPTAVCKAEILHRGSLDNVDKEGRIFIAKGQQSKVRAGQLDYDTGTSHDHLLTKYFSKTHVLKRNIERKILLFQ